MSHLYGGDGRRQLHGLLGGGGGGPAGELGRELWRSARRFGPLPLVVVYNCGMDCGEGRPENFGGGTVRSACARSGGTAGRRQGNGSVSLAENWRFSLPLTCR